MNATAGVNDSTIHEGIYFENQSMVSLVSITINLILNLPLNVCVMWLILRASREREKNMTSDFFSLNLAMAGVLFSLSSLWYLLCSQSGCSLVPFSVMLGLLFVTSPVFRCCICVDCYIGVVHPVSYLRLKPLKYRLTCSCIIWLISLSGCMYLFFTSNKPLHLYGNFTLSVLVLCVMLFCCLSVLKALKNPGPGHKVTGKKTSNAMKRRAFKIISLMLVSSAVTSLFFIVMIPLQCCFKLHNFYLMLETCIDVALVTGFLQPLLYLHRSGKLTCVKKQ